MASPLATSDDFEARYGPAPDTVDGLLADASNLILAAVKGSEVQWVVDYSADELPEDDPEDPDDSGPAEVPGIVVSVAVAAARRAMQNPDGIASESLGAHSVSYEGGASSFELTSQERRIVRREAGFGSHQAVTLATPYSGDDSGDSISDNDLIL